MKIKYQIYLTKQNVTVGHFKKLSQKIIKDDSTYLKNPIVLNQNYFYF